MFVHGGVEGDHEALTLGYKRNNHIDGNDLLSELLTYSILS